jgi:hypothetical protein
MVLAQKNDMNTNEIEVSDINPQSFIRLIIDKGAQNIHWNTKSLFDK